MTSLEVYADHFSRPIAEIVQDLESYADLLKKWQVVQNLVSRETLNDVWARHFIDSLQVLKFVPEKATHFLDVGSGGGFPALPLAIAKKGDGARFTLVEPNSRKVSFLRTVARELSLNVDVIGLRCDQIDSRETGACDVITSRALASLPQLCSWIHPFFGSETKALLHKGREHVEELREADAHWQMDVLTLESDTDPGGVILAIDKLRRK